MQWHSCPIWNKTRWITGGQPIKNLVACRNMNKRNLKLLSGQEKASQWVRMWQKVKVKTWAWRHSYEAYTQVKIHLLSVSFMYPLNHSPRRSVFNGDDLFIFIRRLWGVEGGRGGPHLACSSASCLLLPGGWWSPASVCSTASVLTTPSADVGERPPQSANLLTFLRRRRLN